MAKKTFINESLYGKITIEEQVEEGKGKKYIVSGPFTVTDRPNGNNRVYPKEVMQKAIAKFRKKVENRAVKMSMDHPDWMSGGPKLSDSAALLIDITDVQPDGFAYYKAQIADTQKGKDLKALIDIGAQVGVSTRGCGGCNPDQEIEGYPGRYDIITDPFSLENIDFVDTPSVSETEGGMHCESKKGEEDMSKTVEELKKEFPALCDELLSGFQKKLEDAANELNITKKVVEEKTAESTAIITKKDEELKALSDSVAAMKVKSDELQKIVDSHEAEKIKNEKQHEIELIKSADAKFFTDFEFLAKNFENMKDKNEVRSYYESQKSLIDSVKNSITTKVNPKTESSVAKTDENGLNDEQKSDFDFRNEQRVAGGMTRLTVEQYKTLFDIK
jgi:hypothetical protein